MARIMANDLSFNILKSSSILQEYLDRKEGILLIKLKTCYIYFCYFIRKLYAPFYIFKLGNFFLFMILFNNRINK